MLRALGAQAYMIINGPPPNKIADWNPPAYLQDCAGIQEGLHVGVLT